MAAFFINNITLLPLKLTVSCKKKLKKKKEKNIKLNHYCFDFKVPVETHFGFLHGGASTHTAKIRKVPQTWFTYILVPQYNKG